MDGAAVGGQSRYQFTEAVVVRRGRRDGDPIAALIERTDIQSFSAEVESEVQHGVWEPPW
jgi:hypothetical protein